MNSVHSHCYSRTNEWVRTILMVSTWMHACTQTFTFQPAECAVELKCALGWNDIKKKTNDAIKVRFNLFLGCWGQHCAAQGAWSGCLAAGEDSGDCAHDWWFLSFTIQVSAINAFKIMYILLRKFTRKLFAFFSSMYKAIKIARSQ